MSSHALTGARTPNRTQIVPRPVYVVFAILITAIPIAILGNSEAASVAGAVGTSLGLFFAGAFFIVRSSGLDWRERRAWSLVGVGLLISATGIVVVVLQVLIVGDAPTVGPTDLFFIVGYSIAIVGFGTLPHTAGPPIQRARIAIDGLIGAISIGSLFWVAVLGPLVQSFSEATAWERIIGSLYPILDLAAIVVFMIVLARRSTYRFDIRIMIFTGAIMVQAIADISYLVAAVGQSFATAEPLHAAYVLAALAFLLTSLIVDRVPQPREYADRRAALWTMLAPYGAAATMVMVLLSGLTDGRVDVDDTVLLVATIAVGLLVVARQGIAIQEYRMLVEQQRSDLVSSISHELRTPLTAMVGFLEIVKEDSSLSKDERIEMVEIVAEQAMYLQRIVEDLLSLAHGAPDRLNLSVSEHSVAPIVENAILATAIDRRNLEVEVAPGLTAVVDGNRLQQVLVNLLANAVRYGGDRCLIAAYADGGGLIVEVHDSGPGVPKKYEIRIWERFERGQNRYNAAVPGSGIGLAMVKSVAESHGGRASYRQSDRLGGGCFIVDLPGRASTQQPIAVVPGGRTAIG